MSKQKKYMKPVTNLVSAVGEVVDRLTLPGREKKQLETDILQLLLSVEEKTLEEQASVIREEARGNWLQRSWRPIVMLTFALIVLAGTFMNLPILADTSRFWDLLEIGLGGYIIGRGSEQIACSLLKRKK
ncbi:3TM-type holin [Odoribacter sp. AF15-53]|uniref:3TM-type holin n=1 Tax=Odoribacter sp. AF15-53 TaxID=2292236 RepID=UPI001F29AC2A|nr:3TM-type holin [Odoribacter sp. AF15-53]